MKALMCSYDANGLAKYEGEYDSDVPSTWEKFKSLMASGICVFMHWERESWYMYKNSGSGGVKVRPRDLPKTIKALYLIYGE